MRKHAGPALAIVLIAVVLYFGSYYALVDRSMWAGSLNTRTAFPGYPIARRLKMERQAKAFFLPANLVDRQLRPSYWRQRTWRYIE